MAYSYPVLTQTFTTREVLALRAAGLDVRVFSARAGRDAQADPEAAAEAERTTYLPSPFSMAAIGAVVGWALRRPLTLLRAFVRVFGGRYADDAVRCRLRAPLHFVYGACLAAALRPMRIGRIHAQFVDAGSTVAWVAAQLVGARFSFTNHTAYNPYHLVAKARTADLIVSISEFDRDRVVAACGESVRQKIFVSRVGIPLAPWRDVERDPVAGQILSVGALREKKGHDVLIRACADLRDRGVPVTLRIIGSGAEESALRVLAADLDVPVAFLGAVGPEAVRAELSRAAVFCLACRVARNGDVDGIPVAIMEAMAAGVPVVSTRVSGVPELVHDEESGLLATSGDPESLADSLHRVLVAPRVAEGLACSAASAVGSRHDLAATSTSLARALVQGGTGA